MSVLTLESLAEAFAKKDAEIERLKRDLVDAVQNIQAHSMIVDASEKDAEIERLNKACETLRVSHRNGLALITELRDALVFYAPFSSEPHYRDLIQRARDATR